MRTKAIVTAYSKTTLALGILLVAAGTLAAAQSATAIPSTYYLPNGLPFSSNFSGNGMYQQVFDASLFPGKVLIYSLAFVPDQTGLPGFGFGKYQIGFSVTTKAVCRLDGSSLSLNTGSKYQTFFNASLNGGVTIIGLPYVYDPQQGNLLMTVRVSGKAPVTASPTNYQGFMFRGPGCQGTSRAYNFPFSLGGVSGTDDVGLVTIFSYLPMFTTANAGSSVQQAQTRSLPVAVAPEITVVGDQKDGSVVWTH
jgi:hypothetical protein